LISVFKFIWHPHRNPNGISVSMGIRGTSVVGCSVYVYVSPFSRRVALAGDLNARMKGIANCTKAQVLSQLPGESQVKVLCGTTRHRPCPPTVWIGL
jgi:hypothetical protein